MSAALWLVHQPGRSHRPAADRTALLLPSEGLLTLHAARCAEEKKKREKKPHPLISSCPQAVLACINVTSLRQMFLQFQDLPELWRISKIDFVSAPRHAAWRPNSVRPPQSAAAVTVWRSCLCPGSLGGNLAVSGGAECGPRSGHRRGVLYDDCHLSHTKVCPEKNKRFICYYFF